MEEPQERLINKAFILLIAISLFIAMGFSMIMTLITAYSIDLGANLSVAGIIGGVFSLAALLIRPVSGIITDKKNRKVVLAATTLTICLVIIGYAFAPNIAALMVLRIIHGFAFGINGTVNIALVSEFIPKKRLGEGIGYFGLGQVLAQVVGPNLGVIIRDVWGYQTMFLLISASTLFAFFIIALLPYQAKFKPQISTVNSKSTVTKILSSMVARESIVYALIAGVFSLCNGIVNAFLVIIGDSRNIPNIALFFTVNAIVLFAFRLFMGKYLDRFNLSIAVNISLVLSAVSMLLVGYSSVLFLFLIAALFKAAGQGGGQIALQTACIKRVDASRVGVATSTYFIGADIGNGLGPIISGKLADLFNYEIMFSLVAALIMVAMLVFNLYQKHEARKNLSSADS